MLLPSFCSATPKLQNSLDGCCHFCKIKINCSRAELKLYIWGRVRGLHEQWWAYGPYKLWPKLWEVICVPSLTAIPVFIRAARYRSLCVPFLIVERLRCHSTGQVVRPSLSSSRWENTSDSRAMPSIPSIPNRSVSQAVEIFYKAVWMIHF